MTSFTLFIFNKSLKYGIEFKLTAHLSSNLPHVAGG